MSPTETTPPPLKRHIPSEEVRKVIFSTLFFSPLFRGEMSKICVANFRQSQQRSNKRYTSAHVRKPWAASL